MALHMYNDHLLIAFAQQGHPEAIAAMLNYYFNDRQIEVKVGWEEQTLILLCESTALPSSSALGPIVEQILGHLNIQRGTDAILYGRVQDEDEPRWHVPLAGVLSGELPANSLDGTSGTISGEASDAPSGNTSQNAALLPEDIEFTPPNSASPPLGASRIEEDNGQPSLNDHSGFSQTNFSQINFPQTNFSQTNFPQTNFSQTNFPQTNGSPQPQHAEGALPNGDRFVCCILASEDRTNEQELETVLLPIASIRSILHIAAEAILPVPYMAPCVLGVYPSGGQMLWVVDLWQQLTNRSMSDRPHTWAHRLTTLVIQAPESNELIGFAIPQIEDQLYHCPAPQSPAPSSLTNPLAYPLAEPLAAPLAEPILPFFHQYDPVSRRAILSIDALIQDPRLQMHRT